MRYYLHSSTSFSDEKITELFIHFDYAGLGLFYTLLEKLALQEKPIKESVLKKQLFVGKRLEKCWNFMHEIGLISTINGETFNKNVLNFTEKYQIKSEKNKIKISEWRENQKNIKNVTGYEPKCNQRKVNKSKVNKSKDNNIEFLQNSLHQKIIQIHSDFYQQKTGVKYKFSGGADGKAAKELIEYFKGAVNPPTDEKILESFSAVLNFYDRWDEFYQGQLKICQICANLPNIIANIKQVAKKPPENGFMKLREDLLKEIAIDQQNKKLS